MKFSKPTFYTHPHNIEGCLANGSFYRRGKAGLIAHYMNGDFMGWVDQIPDSVVEVSTELALQLIPKCCK